MPDENEQNKEHSRISVRIGEFQVELEGTYDNIKKLMGKELFDFTKGLQETKKQLPSSTDSTPAVTPKAPAVIPKEKTVPPPARPSTTPEALSKPSRVSAIGKVTGKMRQKKIGGRKVAIMLGLICIVLAAGLVGAIAVYMPMVNSLESQIAEKDSTISSLNLQALSLTSQVSSLQDDLEQANSTISEYQQAIQAFNSQVAYYLSIIYLNETGYLLQPATQTFTQNASNFTIIYNNMIQYAGYVSVAIESSSNTTYAQVIYSSYGVNYDHNVTVGTGGTAVFPVLPGEIAVGVGNTEPVDNVTGTVTAIYNY
jgi:hypothetical protein